MDQHKMQNRLQKRERETPKEGKDIGEMKGSSQQPGNTVKRWTLMPHLEARKPPPTLFYITTR